jgi:hypothetical protein
VASPPAGSPSSQSLLPPSSSSSMSSSSDCAAGRDAGPGMVALWLHRPLWRSSRSHLAGHKAQSAARTHAAAHMLRDQEPALVVDSASARNHAPLCTPNPCKNGTDGKAALDVRNQDSPVGRTCAVGASSQMCCIWQADPTSDAQALPCVNPTPCACTNPVTHTAPLTMGSCSSPSMRQLAVSCRTG